jgi:hypothetical protein
VTARSRWLFLRGAQVVPSDRRRAGRLRSGHEDGDLDNIEREVERRHAEMAIERDKMLMRVKARLKGGGAVLH